MPPYKANAVRRQFRDVGCTRSIPGAAEAYSLRARSISHASSAVRWINVWLPSCPDCQEIDRNPEWHRWLLEADALTGRPWQVLLNDAIAKGNAARVSAFFRFRQEAGGVQSPVCTENSNPDVVVMESAQDLERCDAPGPLNRARNRRIFVQ